MSIEKDFNIVNEMKEIRKNAKKYSIKIRLSYDRLDFLEDAMDEVIVIEAIKGSNSAMEIAIPTNIEGSDILLIARELIQSILDFEMFEVASTKGVGDVYRGIFKK